MDDRILARVVHALSLRLRNQKELNGSWVVLGLKRLIALIGMIGLKRGGDATVGVYHCSRHHILIRVFFVRTLQVDLEVRFSVHADVNQLNVLDGQRILIIRGLLHLCLLDILERLIN